MELKEYQQLYELGNNHFWFVGRKMIVNRLMKQINGLGSPLILDVGCGTGDMTELLNNYGRTIGMDSSSIALGFCKMRQLQYLSQGSIMNLPFKEKRIDLLTSFDALSHSSVTDQKAALDEFHRVLKDDGYILIMDVACGLLKSGHDVVYETRERYNKRQIRVLLENAGFTILKISYANFFLFPVIFLMRTIRRLFDNSKSKPISDLKPVSPLVNLCLINVIKIESYLIQRVGFPIGSSIICLAKKESL
jgi:SAM-dependent methyltransferase